MSDAEAEKDLVQRRPWRATVPWPQWPPIVDDPTHAPPAPVTRSEFDAIKREVEALKAKHDAAAALVDLCERTAARYRDEFRKAYAQKDDGAALANSTGAVCWEEVGRRLAAILKTTE